MINYLYTMKDTIIKNKKVYTPKNNDKKIIDIINELGIKMTTKELKKQNIKYTNSYNIIDKMIYFYPVNDGIPTYPFKFYVEDKSIINNQGTFQQIDNLDDVLLKMVRIYSKALDKDIVLNPYGFMLRLDDEIKENYKGNATLVLTDKAIINQELNEKNFDEANKYFINQFLDHFIGWNFGLSVNRNKLLKKELERLNNKVISKKLREFAGSGKVVYGEENNVKRGLQHYYLPVEKPKKYSL